MVEKVNGIHILWDLYECNFDFFINKKSHISIKKFFETELKKTGFNVVWSMIYTFPNNSFSLNIMLSESHFCIHTWPEINYVSIDLFVCNYTKDNTLLAKKFFDEIILNFCSKNKVINIFKR